MILRFGALGKVSVLRCSHLAGRFPARCRHNCTRRLIVVKIINAGLLCLAFCAAATPASAQTWTDKGFVNVNVGFQAGSHSPGITPTDRSI